MKFYLKNHRLSDDRYMLLSNDYDGFRVLSTLVNILHYLFTELNENASIGFIGTKLAKEENCINTKRFRIYKNIAKRYFSPKTFEHAINVENSSYLLLNRKSAEPELKLKIEDMFVRIYLGTNEWLFLSQRI